MLLPVLFVTTVLFSDSLRARSPRHWANRPKSGRHRTHERSAASEGWRRRRGWEAAMGCSQVGGATTVPSGCAPVPLFPPARSHASRTVRLNPPFSFFFFVSLLCSSSFQVVRLHFRYAASASGCAGGMRAAGGRGQRADGGAPGQTHEQHGRAAPHARHAVTQRCTDHGLPEQRDMQTWW